MKKMTPFKKEIFKILSIILITIAQLVGTYFIGLYNIDGFDGSFVAMIPSFLLLVVWEIGICIGICVLISVVVLSIENIFQPLSKFIFSLKYLKKLIKLYKDDYPQTKFNKTIRWIKRN